MISPEGELASKEISPLAVLERKAGRLQQAIDKVYQIYLDLDSGKAQLPPLYRIADSEEERTLNQKLVGGIRIALEKKTLPALEQRLERVKAETIEATIALEQRVQQKKAKVVVFQAAGFLAPEGIIAEIAPSVIAPLVSESLAVEPPPATLVSTSTHEVKEAESKPPSVGVVSALNIAVEPVITPVARTEYDEEAVILSDEIALRGLKAKIIRHLQTNGSARIGDLALAIYGQDEPEVRKKLYVLIANTNSALPVGYKIESDYGSGQKRKKGQQVTYHFRMPATTQPQAIHIPSLPAKRVKHLVPQVIEEPLSNRDKKKEVVQSVDDERDKVDEGTGGDILKRSSEPEASEPPTEPDIVSTEDTRVIYQVDESKTDINGDKTKVSDVIDGFVEQFPTIRDKIRVHVADVFEIIRFREKRGDEESLDVLEVRDAVKQNSNLITKAVELNLATPIVPPVGKGGTRYSISETVLMMTIPSYLRLKKTKKIDPKDLQGLQMMIADEIQAYKQEPNE